MTSKSHAWPRGRIFGPLAVVALLIGLLALAGPAQAAFPAANGKIAFSTTRDDAAPLSCGSSCNWDIYTMNPNGTSQQRLTFDASEDTNPARSPDGTKLAFLRKSDPLATPIGPISVSDIYVANLDGSQATRVGIHARDREPISWSPGGTKIAFAKVLATGDIGEIYVARSDGSGEDRLTNESRLDQLPVWSPDSQKIAWITRRQDQPSGTLFAAFVMNADGTEPTFLPITDEYSLGGQTVKAVAWAPGPRPVITTHYGGQSNVDYPGTDLAWAPNSSKLGFIRGGVSSTGGGNLDIATMNADGTELSFVTSDPEVFEQELEWAPDSMKFAYTRVPSGDLTPWPGLDIFTVNSDGSGIVNLTNSRAEEREPSWQPINPPYPRPVGASPLRMSLVPAFTPCDSGSSNATHSTPLSGGSCSPPVPRSSLVAVGPSSTGFARFIVLGSGDCAPFDSTRCYPDVTIRVSITDVHSGTPSGPDYDPPGSTDLTAVATLPGAAQGKTVQITDENNQSVGDPSGPYDKSAATVPLSFPIPIGCVVTDTILGTICNVQTTANALLPGSVVAGKRAIWELGQLQVLDRGADGVAGNGDDGLFETQGVFVP